MNKESVSQHAQCSCGHHDHHGQEGEQGAGKRRLVSLAAGAVIFAAALLWRQPDVRTALFLASYAVLGWRVVYKAVRNLLKGRVLDENFLMGLASVGALAMGEWAEASAVMLFYLIGESFEELAVRRSRRSIAELMDLRPDYANVYIQGELRRVVPGSVNIGDVIVVKPGEKVPLDGVVLQGSSTLDTRALTGEPVPARVGPSDTVLSGCVNQNGVLTIRVSKTFGQSTASKILELVQDAAAKKAPTESFITTFSRYYTPAVVGLAVLLAVLPPLLSGGPWTLWAHRALVFLVVSCPCALVLSVPLGFFSGIGRASKGGILIKGGHYLEALSHLDIVVFDKTGTLTEGTFAVTALFPANGFTEASLLAHAAAAETFSEHPIAVSIRSAHGAPADREALTDFQEMAGLGTSVRLGRVPILAGNEALMRREGIDFTPSEQMGTKVYVAADGRYAGCIVISDTIRPGSRDAVLRLKRMGVRQTVMLTGDEAQTAQSVARALSLDEVHAQLLPHQKVARMQTLLAQKRPKGKLAFVGDGINDAPVLAGADIGVAMGGLGSDAAIEAADVVLMTDDPLQLPDAVHIARHTRRIVWQNILFALGVKGLCLLLGALGYAGMWEAVFADVGVSLLAVLNALRIGRVILPSSFVKNVDNAHGL